MAILSKPGRVNTGCPSNIENVNSPRPKVTADYLPSPNQLQLGQPAVQAAALVDVIPIVNDDFLVDAWWIHDQRLRTRTSEQHDHFPFNP
ncbi:MAG TPA: hypothetical protein VLL25_08735 [Acidimicrobiales bacterium]|nr:hypothetical protein [Acidimicrobiales bacterium]